MQIIIHRINTIEELKKIPKDCGVEIDVRAYGDKLILNHEPHADGEDLRAYLTYYDHAFIIFNIKEDGIEEEVINLAKEHKIENFFLLDVEYPFIYKSTQKTGFRKLAIRYSEVEPIEFALSHKGKADWVWVDTNTFLPLDKKSYSDLKDAGFKLCLVCPERWGRPEDIPKYKRFMAENNLELDAVMTSMNYANEWKTKPI
ncbi:hypothetical protein JXC34_07510 [Candidatus Woesearchaeota archaeon]|nr:hypothetical protein [Candidatus Woesearchaeota archaeon]